MSEPLDELYFQWLYSQVGNTEARNPRATYWRLLRVLYKKEFLWFVPNDDNRIQDGKDLRLEFADGLSIDAGWMDMPCSMLELLIALSRKLSFEADGKPRMWFWVMLENIGLDNKPDAHEFSEEMVDAVLTRVIFRNYDYSGAGGLFPLKEPERDQREVELWYQMCAYVLENT